jgi:hypothetical protein
VEEGCKDVLTCPHWLYFNSRNVELVHERSLYNNEIDLSQTDMGFTKTECHFARMNGKDAVLTEDPVGCFHPCSTLFDTLGLVRSRVIV